MAHSRIDPEVSKCEYVRLGAPDPFVWKTVKCTMESSTDYCKIPGYYGYKWPKLDELYVRLFGTHFDDAHNSLADIRATYECFWRMRDLGLI